MKAQMESRKLISSIEECFPEIRVTEYRRIRMGWEAVVLDINGKYIFRFLNLQRRWPHQQAETALLRWLAPKLKVDVPNYEFVWLGSETHPEKFAGYRKIPGSPATREVFRRKHTNRLGKDLGRFFIELHSIRPPEGALVPGFSRKASLDRQLELYRQVRKSAYPLLDVEARRRAEMFWNKFIEYFSSVDFTPRLIHSDIGGDNIIIDTSTGGLNGMIDWGDTNVGDPARDFMGVFAISPRLGEQALANYDLDKSGFRERIGFYLLAEPFEDIVIGVQESEERFKKRFVGEGLRHLRKRLV